ncbi:SPASM domain-containing protein [Candidatus Poribacteria bacterium]|nr:SPASM domain-containing protein [Candidatus Poribacteria bacterium]
MDEIEKISKNTNKLSFLLMTGGEPFLRNDIGEIAKIFYHNNAVRLFAMPSNGFLGDSIVKNVENILENCPKATLNINISLDSIGKDHDEIRGKDGLFDEAVNTINRLKEIKNSRLNLGVITTISSMNQHRLPEIYNFVTKKLGIEIWSPFLIRGNPRDLSVKNVDMKYYENIGNFLEDEVKKGIFKDFRKPLLLQRFNSAKNLIRRNLIAKMVKEKKCFSPCYSGLLNGVIFENGDVFPCELLDKKFGNLRENEYDFKKIWFSRTADEIRKYIKKSKCYCTHECFLTTNILFNLSYYPEIFYWYLKLL